MFKKLIFLFCGVCSFTVYADDLAPNIAPPPIPLEDATPKPEAWNKFNYLSLGILSVGVGQRISQGRLGFDYSLSGTSVIVAHLITATGNVLCYLSNSELGDRPYLGAGLSAGLTYSKSRYQWMSNTSSHFGPFGYPKILAGYEYRNSNGNPRFFDIGVVPYLFPAVFMRYGISF